MGIFAHQLKDFPILAQQTMDPNSPLDELWNCGPVSTVACADWHTGRHFDPEQVRIEAGDAYGQGTPTGWEVDSYFWSRAVPARTMFYTPQSEAEMSAVFVGALRRGHPVKALYWSDVGGIGTGGHLCVNIGTFYKMRTRTRYFTRADPWTAQLWTQTSAEAWAWFKNECLEICVGAHKPPQPKNPQHVQDRAVLSKLNQVRIELSKPPYTSRPDVRKHTIATQYELVKATHILTKELHS